MRASNLDEPLLSANQDKQKNGVVPDGEFNLTRRLSCFRRHEFIFPSWYLNPAHTNQLQCVSPRQVSEERDSPLYRS